jgi:hypothetical protein
MYCRSVRSPPCTLLLVILAFQYCRRRRGSIRKDVGLSVRLTRAGDRGEDEIVGYRCRRRSDEVIGAVPRRCSQ